MASEIAANADLFLTSSQVNNNRWFYEQQKLQLFPAFKLVASNGRITAVEGALDTQYNNTYGIRLDLIGYPHSLPKIRPRGWKPHPLSPHKFNEGSLCVMRSSQWRKYFTAALVVAKTAIWLNKYELWKRNGNHWPGLEQEH